MVYFGSQFQRFQYIVTWLHTLEQKQWWDYVLWQDNSYHQGQKEIPEASYSPQRSPPTDLVLLAMSFLLKIL